MAWPVLSPTCNNKITLQGHKHPYQPRPFTKTLPATQKEVDKYKTNH